jgi:diaminopimelate decarboxylase
MDRIESVAHSVGKQAPISIRVNPNVDAKTHPYISTGLKENKFGVDMDEALELYQHTQNSKHLTVQGLDCHIGSQITNVSPFLDALDKVLALLEQLNTHNINIQHLDLGGGVGINYEGEETINIQAYINAIISKVGQTEIILEPGRAIVGNAGIFITKVEFLKQNSTHAFAIVDGAMNDLLRPSFYNAYHQVLPINENATGTQANWDLVGPICETGDFLAKNRNLSLSEGDYLALMSAGAYGFTMSSNYNTRPRVAEVMVSTTNHQLIRKRETVQDLFAGEYVVK